jgi:hypothetical protein
MGELRHHAACGERHSWCIWAGRSVTRKGRGLKPLHLPLLAQPHEIELIITKRRLEIITRLSVLAEAIPFRKGSRRYIQALRRLLKHAPELQTNRPDGAPVKWTPAARLLLHLLVAGVMKLKGWTKAKACAHLAKSDPWLSRISGRPNGGEALERQCKPDWLREARRQWNDAEEVGMLPDLAAFVDEQRTRFIEEKTEISSG